ncbi:MAG: putative bifunctional diguanylate cyclase/phosphodiesterase [Gammaproteobacteria bacterium]
MLDRCIEAATARLRRALRRLPGTRNRGSGGHRARSLIGDILLLQLVSALFVGVLAVGGLWWTSNWVIEDNLQGWAEQWISELDDLGMPLYVDDGDDRFVRIESYLRAFPEISFVRYYSASGDILFSDHTREMSAELPVLEQGQLRSLAERTAQRPFIVDSGGRNSSLVRVSKAIWTESMNSGGLLNYDPQAEPAVTATLVGFVELGLDFGDYRAQLTRNIATGSLVTVAVLLLLVLAGWLLFHRTLRPLTELQEPLARLARGRTDFRVEPSGYREIAAIANALNTTVAALHERDNKLHRLANRDVLTGLVNRLRFCETLMEELEQCGVRNRQSALMFIDLDQFKYINDTLGHAAGDRLLIQAARRLESTVRKQDIVSRFGGDEFTILVRDVTREEVEPICQAVVQDMQDHRFVEQGQSFSIACSIGVTMLNSDRFTPAELMAQADMACHDAKSKGRNRFHFYATSGQEREQMAADVGWSQKIRQALADDSLVLHYQPIVNVRTGQPTHYEVLLRMTDDDGALVPPNAFLPAASRFGLMLDIDMWVIRTALRKLAAYRKRYEDICFTLNVSGNIFEDTGLLDYIREHLAINGLTPDTIILEITEQVAVRNVISATRQMAELVEQGWQFAIDDFGAGYSSFNYLKNLPVRYIKIDGAFIRDITSDETDQTIVHSICAIAGSAGKQTIAEYVQDAATLDLLGRLGVDFAQGFYVGPPSPRLRRQVISASISSARRRRKRAV